MCFTHHLKDCKFATLVRVTRWDRQRDSFLPNKNSTAHIFWTRLWATNPEQGVMIPIFCVTRWAWVAWNKVNGHVDHLIGQLVNNPGLYSESLKSPMIPMYPYVSLCGLAQFYPALVKPMPKKTDTTIWIMVYPICLAYFPVIFPWYIPIN